MVRAELPLAEGEGFGRVAGFAAGLLRSAVGLDVALACVSTAGFCAGAEASCDDASIGAETVASRGAPSDGTGEATATADSSGGEARSLIRFNPSRTATSTRAARIPNCTYFIIRSHPPFL